MKPEIYRIIDANLNRSREGLRVCEDVARFVLNSKALTCDLKEVRHAISDIAKRSCKGLNALPDSRDADGDVGGRSSMKSEMGRKSTVDIFAANIERVKESLRVLEEFFKLIDRKASIKFCNLRFRVYSIEKKALSSLRGASCLRVVRRSNLKKD